MSIHDEYMHLRRVGHSKRNAKRLAFVHSVKDDEQKQLADGMTYSEEQARQAAVHSRQDVSLAVSILDEISTTARSIRRWLIGGVIIVGAITLRLFA
jgi:hypothetical protein